MTFGVGMWRSLMGIWLECHRLTCDLVIFLAAVAGEGYRDGLWRRGAWRRPGGGYSLDDVQTVEYSSDAGML